MGLIGLTGPMTNAREANYNNKNYKIVPSKSVVRQKYLDYVVAEIEEHHPHEYE
jgi:hypothetical protein